MILLMWFFACAPPEDVDETGAPEQGVTEVVSSTT